MSTWRTRIEKERRHPGGVKWAEVLGLRATGRQAAASVRKDGISWEGRGTRAEPQRAQGGQIEKGALAKKTKKEERVKEKKIQREWSPGNHRVPSWTMLPSRIPGNLLPLDADVP